MKVPTSHFSSKILSFAREKKLWQRGERILAAVSGGPDSLALLLFLHDIAEREGLSVGCCLVQHHLREEAEEEARYVARICERLGIPFFRKDVYVEEARRSGGGSVETVARTLRYEALREVKREAGYTVIALAHHADDQAETILFHLLRGSGARGLSGMAPKHDELIRPFLMVTKKEIEDFLTAFPYTPCHDATNDEMDATRNRIRHQLLPEMLSYNPNLVETLLHTADILRAEDACMEEAAETWLASHGGKGSLEKDAFRSLPLAMRRRVLLRMLLRMGETAVDFDTLSRLALLAGTGEAGKRTSTAHVVMEIGRRHLYFYRGNTKKQEESGLFLLAKHFFEKFTQKDVDKQQEMAIISGKDRADMLWHMEAVRLQKPPEHPARNQYLLDAEKVGDVRLRMPRPGERMAAQGMEGTKSIKRILQDAGIPAALRPHWPIAADDKEIYWTCLLRGSRHGRVTEETKEYLLLTIEIGGKLVTRD